MFSGCRRRSASEVVTDGEFRRGSWHMDFLYQIGGVAKTDQTLRILFKNEAGPVAKDFAYSKRLRQHPGRTIKPVWREHNHR